MTKTAKGGLVTKRVRWLKRRNLTLREFADSLGLDYNTVFRWFSEPRRPQRLYLKTVQKTYRDFPVK